MKKNSILIFTLLMISIFSISVFSDTLNIETFTPVYWDDSQFNVSFYNGTYIQWYKNNQFLDGKWVQNSSLFQDLNAYRSTIFQNFEENKTIKINYGSNGNQATLYFYAINGYFYNFSTNVWQNDGNYTDGILSQKSQGSSAFSLNILFNMTGNNETYLIESYGGTTIGAVENDYYLWNSSYRRWDTTTNDYFSEKQYVILSEDLTTHNNFNNFTSNYAYILNQTSYDLELFVYNGSKYIKQNYGHIDLLTNTSRLDVGVYEINNRYYMTMTLGFFHYERIAYLWNGTDWNLYNNFYTGIDNVSLFSSSANVFTFGDKFMLGHNDEDFIAYDYVYLNNSVGTEYYTAFDNFTIRLYETSEVFVEENITIESGYFNNLNMSNIDYYYSVSYNTSHTTLSNKKWYLNNNLISSNNDYVNLTYYQSGNLSYNVTIKLNEFETINTGFSQEFINNDLISPSISFVSPTELNGVTITTNSISINVSVIDDNYKNVTIYLYNSTGELINLTHSTNNNLFVTYYNLDGGIYYYNATTFDNSNLKNSTETRNVFVWTKAPSIYFNSSDLGTINDDEVTFEVLASAWDDIIGDLYNNMTAYIYNSNGDLFNSYFTNLPDSTIPPATFYLRVNVDELANGLYYYNATSYDAFGNSNSTETRNFTIDFNPMTEETQYIENRWALFSNFGEVGTSVGDFSTGLLVGVFPAIFMVGIYVMSLTMIFVILVFVVFIFKNIK